MGLGAARPESLDEPSGTTWSPGAAAHEEPAGHLRVRLLDQLLVTGPSALDSFAVELTARQVDRVAVFASPSAARAGHVDLVRDAALRDVDVVATFAAVRPHSPLADTAEWVEQLQDQRLDALVSIGGGSVSDTAKAAAILLAEGGHLEDHCTTFTPPDQLIVPNLPAPKLPLFAVPTTLSGADLSAGGGTTTTAGVKRAFWDTKLAAATSCLDTRILAGVPEDVVVTTGFNALAHCAEGLYSTTRNVVSSALATAAAPLLYRGLQALAAGSADAVSTAGLAQGALMAGMVISNARVGLHHGICHVLGGKHGVAHGVANAVMLPHVLRFNLPASRPQQQTFARALTGGTADDAAAVIADLQATTRAPTRLRDVGVARTALTSIAEDVMYDRALKFNPRRVADPAELESVLQAAW